MVCVQERCVHVQEFLDAIPTFIWIGIIYVFEHSHCVFSTEGKHQRKKEKEKERISYRSYSALTASLGQCLDTYVILIQTK